MSKPPSVAQATHADVELISSRICHQITTLSPRQQDRLEAEGRFPRSVKLGSGRNGRKARVKQEVIAWVRDRVAERDTKAG